MKVTVEIDCTPIEARKFFGLPNEVSAWVAGERGAHRSLYWAADPPHPRPKIDRAFRAGVQWEMPWNTRNAVAGVLALSTRRKLHAVG